MSDSNNIIPFSEPPWLAGMPSPYYKETHKRFQKKCRAFIEEHLMPYAMEWEREETVPDHLFETFKKHNMLIPNLPSPLPIEWLKRVGIHDILGTSIEEWDYLHTGIYLDEMGRVGVTGPGGSMTAGHSFGEYGSVVPCAMVSDNAG
jgi:acyl-CoA dehydrogenase